MKTLWHLNIKTTSSTNVKKTFFLILPVTAHLHRSVSWGWPCGGTRAQSEEEGSLEAGSSGFGDVGETPPGGGTADGGEE